MNSYRNGALGLLALIATAHGQATETEAAFERIQRECVSVGEMVAPALKRAAACRIDKGRWFSTIELDDFYQAQYCLLGKAPTGRAATSCRQRALLLFANRAYTTNARLLLERVDPAGTRYDDPQVYVADDGYVMALTVLPPQSAPNVTYYRWHNKLWEAIDTQSWQQTVKQRLPPGSRAVTLPSPDFESMRSRFDFFLPNDDPCCPTGVAEIEFELAAARLVIKTLTIVAR